MVDITLPSNKRFEIALVVSALLHTAIILGVGFSIGDKAPIVPTRVKTCSGA